MRLRVNDTWSNRAVKIAQARKRIELAERRRRAEKRQRELDHAAKTRRARIK